METHLPLKATIPIGFASGGVYLAASVTRSAVRSYRTLSSLPTIAKGYQIGGLLSVALSLRLPSPAINWHRVSMKPGLSSPLLSSGDHPAICMPLEALTTPTVKLKLQPIWNNCLIVIDCVIKIRHSRQNFDICIRYIKILAKIRIRNEENILSARFFGSWGL